MSRENDNHPLSNDTYDWGDERDEFHVHLNGYKVPGEYDCLKDACQRAKSVLITGVQGYGVPEPFSACTVVNVRTRVVERVVVDDANGLVIHAPERHPE